ncbi:DUF3768 domain-containing protein [Pontibacterium granulatum]|uniref:DUF3768 domain-containing protein n=1 Tax=Pontibacterium granulatum TaxID=2036029 RepID=UPI00249A8BCF|nr:DUF3768 domain-containing protein [Pontibacterium granulatum]MDI3326206.1 DUF3768 domain-containing protein [Pontibacterium granulatum]
MIRKYNDSFRRRVSDPIECQHLIDADLLHIHFTAGVEALTGGGLGYLEILGAVQNAEIEEGNDPYGEHNFGSFEHNGVRCFWKIDYYDKLKARGSEDPADLDQTLRVLTIMLAAEY